MKKIIVDSKRGFDRVKAGHPWIYKSQIKYVDKEIRSEEPVAIYTDQKKWVGIGWFNPLSTISIRLLTRQQDEAINVLFFEKRIKEALRWRKTYLPSASSLRWVNSESDGLPGLIVDQYQDYLIIQTTTLGMDIHKSLVVEILKSIFQPKGIYERNDFQARALEGLPLIQGCLDGNSPPEFLEIEENGIHFWVDVFHGHKTGFYLDQRDNRQMASSLSKNKEVLDCFSYTGGFSMSCLKGGAKKVLSIDISEEALAIAQKSAALNHVETRWEGLLGNGFDFLKQFDREGKKFDMIILDPPSFTKRKDSIEGALAGYKEINLRAMKMLRAGGVLISASCSHHIQESLFEDILLDAARDAKKILKLIHRGTQGLDHPILPNIPETQYLKCLFFEVHPI